MTESEVRDWLDAVTDELDKGEVATNAPLLHSETMALRCGIMAGMLEAMWLLDGDEPPASPHDHAVEAVSAAINVLVPRLGRCDDE